MNPFNIGVIGVGMLGRNLARCFAEDARARVVWTNDVVEAAARGAAEEFDARWTLDYREVLADPRVDAVAIATPPHLHAQHFVDALAAGKHVLLEKPMAESPANVARIVQAAAQAPELITLEASGRHARLTPKFRFIKALIADGKLGQVYHIHHNHLGRGTFIEYNPQGTWAMNKQLGGGGPFLDWGVYDLSFHLGILGDQPELVACHSFTRNDLRDMRKWVAFSDVEQHGAAWMEFSGGLTYYYERGAGVHGEVANETRVYGTKGGLRFSFTSWDSNEIEFFFTEDEEPRQEMLTVPVAAPPNDLLALTTHFLDCLEGKATPIMPITLAAKHIAILFKILNPLDEGVLPNLWYSPANENSS